VLFVFQPAEEGPGGALPMIEEGVLEGVDLMLAQHVLPVVPAGYLAVREGLAMAASDEFHISVLGVGGHGAVPHQSVDALQVAGQVITSLNTIVARAVDPLQSVVLSLGTIQGGYQYNVIADRVEMTGTVRTFSAPLREEMPRKIEAIVKGITATYGAGYEFDYIKRYPPLINHPAAVDLVRRVGARVFGKDRVVPAMAVMGGEDFAFYLQRVPGCFFWLGAKHPDAPDAGYQLHHPRFDIDESALAYGVQMFVDCAMTYLRENSNPI
jgi:amidohydrolase